MTWLRKENWSIKKGEPWVNCHVRKLWYPSKTISPGPVLQSDIKILSIKAWRNENKTRRGVSRKVLSWHENLLKTTQNENNNKGARQNCSTVRKLNKQDHPSRDIVKIKLYNQQLCYQQHLRLRSVDWAQFSSWIFSKESPVPVDFFVRNVDIKAIEGIDARRVGALHFTNHLHWKFQQKLDDSY